MGNLFAVADLMAPADMLAEAEMKKRGYKPMKNEGDVERLAGAAEKRRRRAERNARNEHAQIEGQERRGMIR